MSKQPQAKTGKGPPPKLSPAPPQTGKKPSTDATKVVEEVTKGTTTTAQTSHPGGPPPMTGVSGGKRTEMEQYFDRLRLQNDRIDDSMDAIGPLGLKQMCVDLQIPEGELDFYIVVKNLGATQSHCLTRSEFIHAVHIAKIEHLGHLKSSLATWKAQLKEDEVGQGELYFAMFDFIRSDDEKLLGLEKACKAWRILLPESRFALLPQWVRWCVSEYKRSITRDLWMELWEFSRKIRDISTYDPNDKWPTALDDFVDWLKEGKREDVVDPGVATSGKIKDTAREEVGSRETRSRE